MHSKNKGNIGELLVSTQCLRKGYSVFSDIGDNSKVDLLVMKNDGEVVKIQVKMFDRTDSGNTCVPFYKSGPNYCFDYDPKTIDYFAIVDVKTEKIAWLKFSDFFPVRKITLAHKENIRSKSAYNFDDYTDFPF